MPFLFQHRHGTEHHALTRSFVRTCLIRALQATGLTDAHNQPLAFTPHDFRRLFQKLAAMRQLAAKHATVHLGYPAPLDEVYDPEDHVARAKLSEVWAQLGFEHFSDGVHVLDLNLATLDESLEQLQKKAEQRRTID